METVWSQINCSCLAYLYTTSSQLYLTFSNLKRVKYIVVVLTLLNRMYKTEGSASRFRQIFIILLHGKLHTLLYKLLTKFYYCILNLKLSHLHIKP